MDSVKNNLPPVIRVFLSSTFADMEKERSYFNEVIVPKLNRICSERGVSFFSVDLRWGITQEDQVVGNVLPICLNEIDKCRPYFIGILGNRYGSVVEEVPPHTVRSIPWLEGREGHSITELEMLYAVLDCEKSTAARNCSFYIRSGELNSQWYNSDKEDDGRLVSLKERILNDGDVASDTYNSLEEFGEKVMKDILCWLDKEFPVPERVYEIRRKWYNGELLRDYINNSSMERFLDNYVVETKKSLMIYGDGARGKTAFLTAWKQNDANKILINCGSDDAFLYWPAIAAYILFSVKRIDEDAFMHDPQLSALLLSLLTDDFDSLNSESFFLNADFGFLSNYKLDDFRKIFIKWLEEVKLKEKIYIVINDINLLQDDETALLSWIPASCSDNIRIICSSNDEEMISNAENLGWNIKEMSLFENSESLIRNLLHSFGKNLSANQMSILCNSFASDFPGQLRFIIMFLIKFGRFENLDKLIADISALEDIENIYRYVYNYLISSFSESEKRAIRTVFGILSCTDISLKEQDCFDLTRSINSTTVMEWSKIRPFFEQFGVVKGDLWNIREEEIIKFVTNLLDENDTREFNDVLGNFFLERFRVEKDKADSVSSIRENTNLAKAIVSHFCRSKNYLSLMSVLFERELMLLLSKLEWRAIRFAFINIFLYSDIDFVCLLEEMVNRYSETEEEDSELLAKIYGLFEDFSVSNYPNKVKSYFENKKATGTFSEELFFHHSQSFSKVFIPVRMMAMKNMQLKAIEYVDRLIEHKNTLNPYELCSVYMLKCECELDLMRNSQLLESANEYFNHAVRSGLVIHMITALSLRSDALFRLGRYKSALKIKKKVSELSLKEGNVRFYLSSLNIISSCYYHLGLVDESVKGFENLEKYWGKLSDTKEVYVSIMNKANAYIVNGQYETAFDILDKTYKELSNNKELIVNAVSVLGNMGTCAYKMKKYDDAEICLLRAFAEAHAIGQVSTFINTGTVLTEMYKERGMQNKAVQIYGNMMEFFWNRKAYSDVIECLKSSTKLLIEIKYVAQARKLEESWREKFAEIENGEKFFDENFADGSRDSHNIESLKEMAAVAKSENNMHKLGMIYCTLAQELRETDLESACEYVSDAIKLLSAIDKTNCSKAVILLISMLVHKGKVVDEKLYDSFVRRLDDAEALRISDVRVMMGSFEVTDFDNKEKVNQFNELLSEMINYYEVYPELVLDSVCDVSKQISYYCDCESLTALFACFTEEQQLKLLAAFEYSVLYKFERRLATLMRDYESPLAMMEIEYFEKCIKFLVEIGSEKIAMAAGNIALIFRRKKNKDKTIYYHELSTRLYKKAGIVKDYLIEVMNTASAYVAFDDFESAVSLLREGLVEAQKASEKSLEASIAGNIASFMVRMNKSVNHDEIIKCFAIEEKFFREAEAERELAISLINQAFYLHDKPGEKWKEIVREAGELVRKNDFKDFMDAISKLEYIASGDNSEESSTEISFEELLALLLEANDTFKKINQITIENGVYHAICDQGEEDETSLQKLHVFYNPKEQNRLFISSTIFPKMYSDKSFDTVEQYIEWWNKNGNYELRFIKEEQAVSSGAVLTAGNTEELVRRFSQYSKLWIADTVSLKMMFIGICNLSMAQGLKLRAMNEE